MCCTHYYLDLKRNDLLVITQDFPKLGIYTGMIGRVEKVGKHQKAELLFILTSQVSKTWTRYELNQVSVCFIKEDHNILKKFL